MENLENKIVMVENNLEDSKKILEDIKEYLGDIGWDLCIIRGSVTLFVIIELIAMWFVLTL